jgi:hypothetical protein
MSTTRKNFGSPIHFDGTGPNPGSPGNPNEPLPSPGIVPPERQSPAIPPDFVPYPPPEEPQTPLPGPDPSPGPSGPEVHPHEPIRVV